MFSVWMSKKTQIKTHIRGAKNNLFYFLFGRIIPAKQTWDVINYGGFRACVTTCRYVCMNLWSVHIGCPRAPKQTPTQSLRYTKQTTATKPRCQRCGTIQEPHKATRWIRETHSSVQRMASCRADNPKHTHGTETLLSSGWFYLVEIILLLPLISLLF